LKELSVTFRLFLTNILLATAALAQFPSPFLTENTTRVSDHVYEITGFPNIVFVIGTDATLVVDTGLGPANGAIAARVAKKLAKGPKLYLTTTHFHPEHAAGEAGFPPETVILRAAVQQQELNDQGETMVRSFGRFSADYGPLLKDVTKMRNADVTFDNELTLSLGGGVTVRLLYYGPGHTKGDEMIFVQPDSALITGDIVQNKVVPGVAADGGSFASWITVLDKLDALKPKIVIPTHSRVGDGSLIAQEKAFILDMRARSLAMKKQGLSAADAGKRLQEDFKTAYPAWAANTDWPNLNSVPGLAQRFYVEDK
jgi:glyoxylase-like metal-dependent hydrolase (beta-lactamase superfamily II)